MYAAVACPVPESELLLSTCFRGCARCSPGLAEVLPWGLDVREARAGRRCQMLFSGLAGGSHVVLCGWIFVGR